ncbi:MAG TPA: DNA polymerase III subunit alpha, partial [Kineosporiaceae bacterium]|nr:DNA polymerase III subunit alpha [Kineosporiaceae bacterium]
GGAAVDPRHPRVTVLALGADRGAGLPPAAGWGRLCRLVSAGHLRGDRGSPVVTAGLIGEHAAGPVAGLGALAVLLGPGSEAGRAVLARRPDLALAELARWRELLPAGSLYVEVVCHHGPPGRPASLGHAARMLQLARLGGVPAVLTNAVRYATPDGAVTVDVLDAARRLVPLDLRHVDRVSAEGYLADGDHMAGVAREVARAAGEESDAAVLLATTETLASRCRLDPRADLGIGTVHFPEADAFGLGPGDDPQAELRRRCVARIGTHYPGIGGSAEVKLEERLDDELAVIGTLGYAPYFLTIDEVCGLIRELRVRVAARGSGAGSLVNHLLGISGVDPLRHGLLMERFLTPLRAQLPDIDIDVEAARRTEVYEKVIGHFGAERVTCVSMMDTYRIRHAIRDVGAAVGLPPGEVDTIAKSFPHIRARDIRLAVAELPELQASGLAGSRLDLLFDLVERLDGLPRHVALHPCGVVLSDAGLLDRTPVEASWQGFPMSQFDKDDVEEVGLLKLDILGVRMQSAMAYALDEIARVDGPDTARAGEHPPQATEPGGYLDPDSGRIDLDAVPHDDDATFRLIRSTHTLGLFQIESPGQRELVGKFAPQTFDDLIIDISLFRPGPVKSDMVTPFLRARQGWDDPDYLHPSLEYALAETAGVVVFHEQVLQLVATTAGCGLAEADEVRRAMGSPEGQAQVEAWWRPRVRARGDYDDATVERIWEVLKAFASFGFCKAHAAAFALPTYHSAWLKAHHPAAFLAGVLTHDPGMYPKRLILDDARNLGIAVLPLDVNHSDSTYRVEKVTWCDELPPRIPDQFGPLPQARPHPDLPDGRAYGIRLALDDVKGITAAEVAGIVAGRPYRSLADFWHRAQVSRPVVERLVVAGAFDSLYGLGATLPVSRRDRVTRRDLLLQVAELDRWSRSVSRGRARTSRLPLPGPAVLGDVRGDVRGDLTVRDGSAAPGGPGGAPPTPSGTGGPGRSPAARFPVREAAARQSRAPRAAVPADRQPVQLALDLGDAPDETRPSGLPEMTGAERVRAELEVLGLDASRHVLDFYAPLLDALQVTRSREVLGRRSRAELLVAGVKVATQTPPVRSGRRVVFLTLDDATGPVDATFFEDAQGPYAATVFHSWLLVVRGILRRTGDRGVSLRATGAWELPALWDAWTDGGLPAVRAVIDGSADPTTADGPGMILAQRPPQPRLPYTHFGGGFVTQAEDTDWEAASGLPTGDRSGRAGGMGGGPRHRRVLVHVSGFRQSPYADVLPPGETARDTRRMLSAEESVRGTPPGERAADRAADQDAERRLRSQPPRKLWHASPGSSGR